MRLQFIQAHLGEAQVINEKISENDFDVVMHFACVAYVGESTAEQGIITSNTLLYSSTCATYEVSDQMPIKEDTPQSSTSTIAASYIALVYERQCDKVCKFRVPTLLHSDLHTACRGFK